MKWPGLIFDLDGTLIDSVYQHVTAWHSILLSLQIKLPQWRIHQAIGMSGRLFLPKLLREVGYRASNQLVTKLEALHAKRFRQVVRTIQPLPGSSKLLELLRRRSVPFAVATSGDRHQAETLLKVVTSSRDFPLITADDVEAAKPAPDLFDLAAIKLEKEPGDCFIVGDSVWDVLAGRRMNASVVALKSGGFGERQLQESGAYRVYADPLELGANLEELGFDFSPDAERRRGSIKQ